MILPKQEDPFHEELNKLGKPMTDDEAAQELNNIKYAAPVENKEVLVEGKGQYRALEDTDKWIDNSNTVQVEGKEAKLYDVVEQSKWVDSYFTNHKIFKSTDKVCIWSDDYTEIFLYLNEIAMMPMLRIQNVEMINECLLVTALPDNETNFKKLLELSGFIIEQEGKEAFSGDKGRGEGKWKVIAHSHQIADTGDYDGCYQLTDGNVSIYTKDDGQDAEDMLNDIANLLNTTDFNFYLDDSEKELNFYLTAQIKGLQDEIAELKNQPPYTL